MDCTTGSKRLTKDVVVNDVENGMKRGWVLTEGEAGNKPIPHANLKTQYQKNWLYRMKWFQACKNQVSCMLSHLPHYTL